MYLIDELLSAGASVTAFDPEGMNNAKQLLGDKISFAENQYDALSNADALIIATEWSVFRTPDFEMVTKRLKNKVIFDGRNVYGNEQMKQLGYHYESIGRDIVTQ